MQHSQRQERYGNNNLSVYYRHRPLGRHAHWLASHGLSRDRHVLFGKSGELTLETGEALLWWLCSPSANSVSLRQGLVWLFLATTVELLPLVRPVGYLQRLHPSLFRVVGFPLFGSGWYFFLLQSNNKGY